MLSTTATRARSAFLSKSRSVMIQPSMRWLGGNPTNVSWFLTCRHFSQNLYAPLMELDAMAASTSPARMARCCAMRVNSSRLTGSIARSRIRVHSAASRRNFSGCACMSFILYCAPQFHDGWVGTRVKLSNKCWGCRHRDAAMRKRGAAASMPRREGQREFGAAPNSKAS